MKTQRETPVWLAEHMSKVLWEELYECQKHADKLKSVNILEPSCGTGNLINELLNLRSMVKKVFGVELNADLVDISKKRFELYENTVEIIRGDALQKCESIIEDENILAVLMCPPFKNNLHIEHIHKILSVWNKTEHYMTDRKPVMVSLIHNSFWTDNSEVSRKFRETLNDERYDVKFLMVPDNTFIEKGKSVPCSIMVLKYTY